MNETENEQNEEKEDFSKFVSGALRGPRKGTYEQLLCQHLISSVTANPLKKIKLTCEAAMMAEPEKAKGFNQEELETFFNVSNAFSSASQTKIDQIGTRMYAIPWPFSNTEENYDRYIKPWHISASYFINFIRKHRQTAWKLQHHDPFGHCDAVLEVTRKSEVEDVIKDILATYERCPGCHGRLERNRIHKEETTIIVEEPEWSFFFEMSQCLSQSGFQTLLNSFVAWAMPKAMTLSRELSKNVDPSLYREMFALLGKKEVEDTSESVLGSRK